MMELGIMYEILMLNDRDKARLSWHCRRGMLELDIILQDVLESQIDTFSDNELKLFDLLLSNTDPDLFAWFMGHQEPQDKELRELVDIIRNHD